jgi:uncharacterized protein (DUF305 family)
LALYQQKIMKGLIYALGFGLLVSACNNNTGDNGTAHAGHNNAPFEDSTAAKELTMMGIMNNMMKDMMAVPTSSDPDIDFAALMKVHHQSAVKMALLEEAKGTDAEVKQMVQKIISDQQKEISVFTTYLSANKPKEKSDAFYKEAMSEMDHVSHSSMDHNAGIDKQFVQMMIPHHKGAVDMAETYLKYGKDAALRQIANTIIASQQAEIKVFENWLSKHP